MHLEGAEGPFPELSTARAIPQPWGAAQLEGSLLCTQKMKQTSSNGQKPGGEFWQHCRKTF